jgi:ABC-type multidrug transport system ATPase subunit
MQASTGALVRINEVMGEVPTVTDMPDASPLPPLQREIRLTGVGFSYTPERRTLDGIDAVIPAGSRVAFVGPTGAGKSSVLQLLMRFYDPEEGSVLFDGRDLRSCTVDSLRSQIGVVFQDTFLFGTTIRENLALSKPGATEEEIVEAAKAAELDDFVASLPRGYDTLVGERGGRLSGGQRQRLAIARALLRNPRLLVLDEATSALDPKTERLIADTLSKVGEGRTTVAVTHRLTSITHYDRIFVIVSGKLVEAGTHDELLEVAGVYAELWAEQTGGRVPTEAPFDAIGALARVPLFSGLTSDQLEVVASRIRAADLAPSEAIPEGDGRLVIIRRGRARVLVSGLTGELTPTTELGPGDAFGLAALLGGGTGAMLQAQERTSLVVLDDEALAGLAAAFPTVAAALEGSRQHELGPAGGKQLSRMTMVRPSVHVAPSVAAVLPQPSPEEMRQATGAYPSIR